MKVDCLPDRPALAPRTDYLLDLLAPARIANLVVEIRDVDAVPAEGWIYVEVDRPCVVAVQIQS